MKRRLITLILSFAIAFSSATCISAAKEPITVLLNDTQLLFDIDPIIENGRTLVPMRVIFEALGASVEWNYNTHTAFATKNDITIEIIPNASYIMKNNEAIPLDVPARLENNRTLVPIRAVSESMGATVEWNDDLRQVIISTTSTEKAIYNHDELSASDTELLRSLAGSIRYNFEQNYLPGSLSFDSVYASKITAQKQELLPLVFELWNDLVVRTIVQIQSESSYTYEISSSDTDTEALQISYLKIAEKVGLKAETLFTASYENTFKNHTVMLITFNNADNLSNCKYIGIVPIDNQLRYFTAEKDLSNLTGEVYIFCETAFNSHSRYNTIGTTKVAFLKAIDEIINTYWLEDDYEDSYSDADAVQTFVDKLADNFAEGFSEQTGGIATMNMRADNTTIVMTLSFLDMSSDELELLGNDSLEDLINQLADSDRLYNTLKEEEPAVDAVMIELCGNDSRVVFSKSFS